MSETYGRRRGRLAAAKIEPVNGHYVAFLNKKIEQDIRDRVAAAEVGDFVRLGTFTLEPMPPEMLAKMHMEQESERTRAALLLAEQPVKKKRGPRRKKEVT